MKRRSLIVRTSVSLFAVLVTMGSISAVVAVSAQPAGADGVALKAEDVLASVGNGLVDNYSPSGTLLDTLDTTTDASYTTGGCFDSSGDFFVTDFDSNEISEFNASGNLVNSDWASPSNSPESCTVDASNDIYVGGPGGPIVYEYNSSGTQLNAFSVAGGSGTGGTDWLDLESDQCTLLYTGEGSEILSYNACTQTQNPDFATGLPEPCFALRIRPDGDVMVACASEVLRFNSTGTLLQTYTIPNSSTLFAMNLDPDNTSFWTGDIDNGTVSHIDIATGDVLTQFNSSPGTSLAGLTLVGGIIVSQPTLTLSPPTASANVGSSDTVTATITNPGGSISDQTVDFSVSGANTTTGTATTNASGQATFSYVAANVGSDTVTGTFLSATGTATVTWATSSGTTVTTSLSGGGLSGNAISVPTGTAVTDQATLSGPNTSTATGTVTYNVYSSATPSCNTEMNAGTPETITTPGTLPASSPLTLPTAGTYYWQASYSGDTNNAASTSTCGTTANGGEAETVTLQPTMVSTSLSGGGMSSGSAISVPTGTAVTDQATLSGPDASAATGTVTYNVYSSDTPSCNTLASTGTPETITTPGTLPASSPVMLPTAGTYYWQASYSGDSNNAASTSTCGSNGEIETVTGSTTTTTSTTSLSGGGQSGASIMVPTGTPVTDSATLTGTNASTATGTVTYTVYSDASCTNAVSTGSPQTITTAGTLPASSPVTLPNVGTYYWRASYSGDSHNASSTSSCGAEVETVTTNCPPTANNQSVSTNQNTAVGVTLTGSDPNSYPLTYAVVGMPAHGTLSGTGPNLTYTPSSGYSGLDSFTFKVNDGHADSNIATVSITVIPASPPTAEPQCVSTPKNTPVPITLTGTDSDGDPLTYSIVTGPAHGTLSGTAPNLTYTPAPGYTGPDSFTFTANDGSVDSTPAQVSITVTNTDATLRCETKGTHGQGQCKWWDVPKHHFLLTVRNHGRGTVSVTIWVNGHRIRLGNVKNGPPKTHDLAAYMKDNGRNVVILDAVGSTNTSDISFSI